jgi:hypothetical protein
MSLRLVSFTLLCTAACAAGPRTAPAPSASATTVSRDSTVEEIRRHVANGSIIADVQLGRTPPMAVGACVNPIDAARFDLDRSLDFAPDHPPVVSSLGLPPLPESLRESEVRTGVVVARMVVDTTGAVLPGSVAILSSPHGLMSVQVCGAVLMARFTPAKDDGRLVKARVEMPFRFVQ